MDFMPPATRWPVSPSIQPVADEFFRPGEYTAIPLVLLHERVVGELSDSVAVAIGLTSPVRSVKVGPDEQWHIFEERGVAAVDDVMVCLNRLEEAFRHLTYLLPAPPTSSEFRLVGAVPSSGRHLVLPVKFVPPGRAKSGKDELWLCTAFPLGESRLKSHLAQGRVVNLPAA